MVGCSCRWATVLLGFAKKLQCCPDAWPYAALLGLLTIMLSMNVAGHAELC